MLARHVAVVTSGKCSLEQSPRAAFEAVCRLAENRFAQSQRLCRSVASKAGHKTALAQAIRALFRRPAGTAIGSHNALWNWECYFFAVPRLRLAALVG